MPKHVLDVTVLKVPKVVLVTGERLGVVSNSEPDGFSHHVALKRAESLQQVMLHFFCQ